MHAAMNQTKPESRYTINQSIQHNANTIKYSKSKVTKSSVKCFDDVAAARYEILLFITSGYSNMLL